MSSFPVGLNTYSFHLGFARRAANAGPGGTGAGAPPPEGMDMPGVLAVCGELGATHVQLDPSHVGALEPARLRAWKDLMDSHDIHASLGCSASLVVDDADELARTLARYEQFFDACRILDATLLRGVLGVKAYNQFLPVPEQLALVRPNLRTLARAARDAGVTVAFENHGGLTSRQLVALVTTVSSEHVKVTLDNGNPLFTFEDPVAAFRRLAPHAAMLHFKDYQRRLTGHGMEVVGVPLGRGLIDLPAQLAIYKEVCPTAPLYLEICLPRGNELRAVRQSWTYLQARLS